MRPATRRGESGPPCILNEVGSGGQSGGLQKLLAVAVVNPRQVRDFAKALGHLAKTDAIVIARFGEIVKPVPRIC